MKYYRLKKEAVPFFKASLSTNICSLDTWDQYGVDMVALEEVEPCYIDYGHKKDHAIWNAGWGANEGAHFHFTLVFPSMKYQEYDKFTKGKMMRDILDRIQKDVNYFYQNFSEIPPE